MLVTNINRSLPLPLHFQLRQILLEKIERGEWAVGALIPSEQELQEIYGLSRITVRQALGELETEGRLNRQRGRGTFVAQPKYEHSPIGHRGISYYLAQQGLTPGWKLLDKKWVTASAEVRQKLGLKNGGKVYCLRRLRLANTEPIGYLIAYLPEAIANDINTGALEEGEAMRYLAHLPQMHHSRVERSLEAVAARKEEAKLLGVKTGSPLMLIDRLIISEDGTPVEFLHAVYRGDRLKYQLEMSEQNGSKL